MFGITKIVIVFSFLLYICYSFSFLFGITKKLFYFFFRLCIIFVTVSVLQVSSLPILFINMFFFILQKWLRL